MNEREKIIEIIAPFISAYGEDEAIADALIAAGIGDVTAHETETEYWKTICKTESDEHHTAIKNAAEHARRLMQERDEYKRRAEVAFRALLICMKDSRPAHCSITGCSKWTRCGDDACVETRRAIFIEQAEREIEEGKGE